MSGAPCGGRCEYFDEFRIEPARVRLLYAISNKRLLHPCCARGRPIIVEWERDARHSAGLSLVRDAARAHTLRAAADAGLAGGGGRPKPDFRSSLTLLQTRITLRYCTTSYLRSTLD
ncbi:hypothetical protein EVAR_6420_1 [Eumeta japonica]|uniref:Uncharacterized protein n=1 Tax=Eumeta variegata TaxID=151549 RepID=A0A4C1TG18_EUMVA|nr:hypothetical protein EVAR_6420_1 [Eumeta japonica]